MAQQEKQLLEKYGLQPESVLEIGCSGGYRLNGIKETFRDCKAFGIEPSEKAVAFGKSNFKNRNSD